MINSDKLAPIVEGYKEYFPEHWQDEKFKWEAVRHFQDNWDINAENFGEMFKEATGKTSNLLASGYAYPRAMILELAKADDNAVREMFRRLYDESIDLSDRVTVFMDTAEELRNTYNDGTWKQHYQNTNYISVYLWLMYPDKYYIYKYEIFKKCSELLDDTYRPKSNGAVDNVIGGFKMYDEIRAVVQSDNEIRQMLDSALTDTCYPDPELVTLTIDIGFYAARFYMDNTVNKKITRCWFVGAYSDSDDIHFDKEFVEKGIWQNGYSDKFLDNVNSVRVGDKIAIKTSYVRKNGLPFDNNGETVSVMKIKIVGTVTGNHMDGRTLDVEWDTSFKPKEWYFYTFRNTITLPKEDDWRTKALIDFVFNDIPQDYDRFQESQIASPGEDNFSEETIDDSDLDTEADRPIYTYEMIQAFHSTQRNIKWFKPIIDALDDLGGSAPRPVVHKRIVDMCNVKDSELAKKNKSGFSQILNDIDWARNYLTYEGILDKNAPSGIWSLSPLGKKIKMTQELVEKIIIKWIKIKTAERENKPIPIIDLTPFYELKIKSYSEKDFLSEVYMTKPQYNTLTALLKHKKNIILQGAPGVGKTFTAKRLAWSVMSEKDDSRIEFIQFHQSYSYEDFIMGYRPDGNSFTLSEGVFYRFCKKARNDPEREYFFIIDEINRGNLSKIFGELLMLIENDYRKESVTLAYKDERFSVPENLYIIGMMNTADRSLAMIDYALRRRFSFFEMCPGFDSEGFKKYSDNLDNDLFNALIVQIKLLNNAIENDSSLGKGFCIGHSYFCNLTAGTCTADRLNAVVEYDIIPMLSEYWFDDKDKFDKWSADLRGIFNDGR